MMTLTIKKIKNLPHITGEETEAPCCGDVYIYSLVEPESTIHTPPFIKLRARAEAAHSECFSWFPNLELQDYRWPFWHYPMDDLNHHSEK